MQEDKIVINPSDLEGKIKGIAKWEIDEKDKKDIGDNFVKALKLGELTNKVVKDKGIELYLSALKTALEFIGKPVSKITDSDIKRLHEAMIDDTLSHKVKRVEKNMVNGKEIKKSSIINQAYSKGVKTNIRRTLILFLKWKLDEKANSFIKILKIKIGGREKDIYAPTEEEVEKLFFSCKRNHERFLIAILFDTGCRAQEFINLRMEDFIFPKKDESFIKVRFRNEYSKTKGRTISCYWKHSTKAITDFYNDRLKENAQPTEPIYTKSYSSASQFIKRLGRKVLKKKLHFHALRHASCSHYIKIIKNEFSMCYRYAWEYGSTMVQRYSRRHNFNEELDKEVEQTELNSLKSEIEKLKLSNDLKNKEIEKMKKDFVDSIENNSNEMKQIRELVKVLKDANKDS